MQLKRYFRVITFLSCVVLVSCGSASYQQRIHDAVSNMSQAIQTYNSATASDLSSTSGACRQAGQDIQNGTGILEDPHPPARYRNVLILLRRAQHAALQGFGDCARAADTLDYPLMVQADTEIATANGWIAASRPLDR